MARTLIHGYYACVSYTDAQIGKLLDDLPLHRWLLFPITSAEELVQRRFKLAWNIAAKPVIES